MLRYKIHFDYPGGGSDSFVVDGDSIEEIQEKAERGVELRLGLNPWSEEIE